MIKVLLVEDNPKVALAITMSLKAKGYEIQSAVDAITAVSKARQFAPDVILLDINLPGGDGFLVAKRLQSITQILGAPFIFMTASKEQGLREKALALGAHEFLEKPFGMKELVHAIESALESPEDNLTDMQIG